MFAVYCPGHQARVLLGPRSVLALRNTTEGVLLHWRCRCGATGAELLGPTSATDEQPAIEPAA